MGPNVCLALSGGTRTTLAHAYSNGYEASSIRRYFKTGAMLPKWPIKAFTCETAESGLGPTQSLSGGIRAQATSQAEVPSNPMKFLKFRQDA